MKNTKKQTISDEIAKEITQWGAGTTFKITTLAVDSLWTAFLYEESCNHLTVIQESTNGFERFELIDDEIRALKELI